MTALWHGPVALGIVSGVEGAVEGEATHVDGSGASGAALTTVAALTPVAVGQGRPGIEEFYAQAEDLVGALVGHLRATGITADPRELEAFGRQGLLEAAHRFDPSVGDDFRRFAYFRVRGAMIDGLRKMGNWSRRGYERIQMLRAAQSASEAQNEESGPLAADVDGGRAAELLRQHMANVVTAMACGVFVESAFDGTELTARDPAASAETQLEEHQLELLVRRAIAELPQPDSEVMKRHYLLGEQLTDVAREMGFDKSWASRIHTRAIKRLGVRLRGLR